MSSSQVAEPRIILMKELPSEAYTVILVKWRDPQCHSATMFTLSSGGTWASDDGVAFEQLEIVDFEVKALPLSSAASEGVTARLKQRTAEKQEAA